MNRVELATRVSERSGLTIRQSSAALSAALAAIGEALAAGETVTLHGFGSFRPRQRMPRNVYHPTTKEPLALPASIAVSFAPASALKRQLATTERSADQQVD